MMPGTRSVHLVGSIGLSDTETVFRTLSETVGGRAPRYPDGETGERHYWIRWQRKVFDDHPDIVLVEEVDPFGDGIMRPFFGIREGVAPADLDIGSLGYADVAIESYGLFRRMRDDGAIPAGTRFQVALPTPVAVISGFVHMDQRGALEPAYERAMMGEVERIAAAVPAADLAIQWDVCYEIVAHDGGPKAHYDDILGGSLDRLERVGAAVPAGVELGFHLCYGDPGHKHIVEPEDTATAVAFANGICALVPRRVDFIHLPVPRGRDDDAYFAPLADLALTPGTELILGLVHFTDGAAGTRRSAAAAEKVVSGFGIGTECGFGRREASTIPDLLRIHAEVADA
jgi:hypothetical protein